MSELVPKRRVVRLVLIALALTLGCAALMAGLVLQSSNDANLVNILGRQRMLAQLMGRALMNEVVIRHMEQDVAALFDNRGTPHGEYELRPGDYGEASIGRAAAERNAWVAAMVGMLKTDWGDIERIRVTHLALDTEVAAAEASPTLVGRRLGQQSQGLFHAVFQEGSKTALRLYIAIRAEASCLECHAGEPGEMLGLKRIDIFPAENSLDAALLDLGGEDYVQAMAVFESTLHALRQGGPYPLALQGTAHGELAPLRHPLMQAKMGEIEAALADFKAAAQPLLTGRIGDLALWQSHLDLSNRADLLRDLSNELVERYTRQSAYWRTGLLAAVLILAVLMAAAYLMVYMVINRTVFMPLRKVLGGSVDFEQYERAESMRKRAQQALAESEARFRRLAQAATEGVVIHDNGRILDCNPAMEKMSGYCLGRLTRMDGFELFAPESIAAVRTMVAQGYEGSYEAVMQRSDGERFPVEMNVRQMPYRGRTARVVMVRDIEQRKEREAERLAAAEQYRITLVREVHHRIKNTLQGIAGLLRQRAVLHPAAREPLEEAIAQLRSVAVVMGLESMDEREAVQLCQLIHGLKQAHEALLQAPLTLDVGDPDARPIVVARDEVTPLALILNELIMNAIKHRSPAQGRVGIQLKVLAPGAGEAGRRAEVTITNPGTLPQTGMDIGAGAGLGTGLTLVRSLLPEAGAECRIGETGGEVVVRLRVWAPVVSWQ